MAIVGYFAVILIGLLLGLIGGGGSTVAVPILVYLFGIEPTLAITYSLFIVGSTSFIGTISYAKNKLIHPSLAISFGLPSIFAVLITRHFIYPAIPNILFSSENFELTKGLFMLLLFSILMLLAAYKMIIPSKKQNDNDSVQTKATSFWRIPLQGVIVGLLTGLIGAGGGFLIIPILIMIGKIPMKEAVGTSLFIITINSLIGFFSGISQFNIDWTFLFTASLIAIIGVYLGIFLSKKINGKKLKSIFGWFILAMGIYIIFKELFLK